MVVEEEEEDERVTKWTRGLKWVQSLISAEQSSTHAWKRWEMSSVALPPYMGMMILEQSVPSLKQRASVGGGGVWLPGNLGAAGRDTKCELDVTHRRIWETLMLKVVSATGSPITTIPMKERGIEIERREGGGEGRKRN